MSKLLKDIVVEEYSQKEVQERYEAMTKKGLWPSEKILFKKYFKEHSKILDIGCGSGRTTFPLLKLGYRVIGVDLTPAMIRTAKKLAKGVNVLADFRVMDATDLKFEDKSFDNILFSFNGWDHIPRRENRNKALKEAYRVLKKGGHFIFSSHIRIVKGKRFWFWTKQWLKIKVLKPIGFKILEEEFGDRFFTRERAGSGFLNKQYTAIPSMKEILEGIEEAGFELVQKEKRLSITEKDKEVPAANCTFFVCKKGDKNT